MYTNISNLDYLRDRNENQKEVLLEDCVKEIVTKENERYKLVSVSLLSSKNDTIRQICKHKDLQQAEKEYSFTELREKIIDILYSEYVTPEIFKSFISDNKCFEEWVVRISKDTLKRLRLRSNISQTIDKDLDPSPYTIAFIVSQFFLSELVDYTKYRSPIFTTPDSIESDLLNIYIQNYPIDIYKLIDLLRKDDSDLWKVFGFVIYKITDTVTWNYLYNKNNKDDIRSEAWIKSNDRIYHLIMSGEIPVFETATHLRNYIGRISLNNIRNIMKKENSTTIYLEDVNDIEKVLSSEWTVLDDFSIFDIDVNNKEEVRNGLVNVLFNKPKGIYETIVSGIEDKIDILVQHSDKCSYRELVKKTYGNDLSPQRQKQYEDNLRQGVSRARKMVVDKFKELIRKKLGDGKK